MTTREEEKPHASSSKGRSGAKFEEDEDVLEVGVDLTENDFAGFVGLQVRHLDEQDW